MSPGKQTTNGMPSAQAWKMDAVFKLFADPVRRRLFLSLAGQDQQTPSQLQGAAERNLDLTIKRLALMRSAGFVVMKPDMVDGRRG